MWCRGDTAVGRSTVNAGNLSSPRAVGHGGPLSSNHRAHQCCVWAMLVPGQEVGNGLCSLRAPPQRRGCWLLGPQGRRWGPHRACGLPTQDVLRGRHVQATSADVWEREINGRGRLGPRLRRTEDENCTDARCFLEFGLINALGFILLHQKHDLEDPHLIN